MVMGLFVPSLAYASVSEQFFQRGIHISDDWGIFRTRATGADGFLGITSTGLDPIIARESLGNNTDVAWELGDEFVRKYPDRLQRAEEIFYYVRNRVRYTSDLDQFGIGEFAQNADEVVESIAANGIAQGDCEDSAVLAAVMYKAAGYRSALVLMPGHVAAIVYLPEYRKAPRKLTLDGEEGWVWAEATGATNPFGWIPESLVSGGMIAREVSSDRLATQRDGTGAVRIEDGATAKGGEAASGTGLLVLLGVVGFLWVAAGRRRDSTSRRW